MWRVHEVHHSETDLDLTTGFRFHPLEALFSQGLSLATIALLGTPPGAVGFAALAFIVQDFFTHANLWVPETADRILRLLIITPAMHRVHHSEVLFDKKRKFWHGQFSVWDRLFGTYLAGRPAASAQSRYGLAEMGKGSEVNAPKLLSLPFRRASNRTP